MQNRNDDRFFPTSGDMAPEEGPEPSQDPADVPTDRAARDPDPEPPSAPERPGFVQRKERVDAEATVQLWVNSKVHDQESRTANISESGMFVVTSKPLPVGTTVRFDMMLKGEISISGFAEVTWIRPTFQDKARPNGMGMHYVGIRGDGAEELREFVSKRLGIISGQATMSENEPL